jgi:hypothetical protein
MRYTINCLLVLFLLFGCSPLRASGQENKTPKPARLVLLPDNPCEAVTAEQISAATGLEVSPAERKPSIGEKVQAQREDREPVPGTICSYETGSEFGAIIIAVPVRANRSATEYWKTRAKYFETYPGAGKFVADVGADAWIAGGASLAVLVGGDEYFIVSTQYYQPGSRELLVKIARVVLSQL